MIFTHLISFKRLAVPSYCSFAHMAFQNGLVFNSGASPRFSCVSGSQHIESCPDIDSDKHCSNYIFYDDDFTSIVSEVIDIFVMRVLEYSYST